MPLPVGKPIGGVYSGGVLPGSITPITGTYINPVISGTFVVYYTFSDSLGCSNMDTSSLTILNCLGVDEQSLLETEIYPNSSSSGVFNIKTSNTFNYDLYVYNSKGQLIMKNKQNGELIDLSHQTDGVYFIHIIDGEAARVFEVIINR